MNSGHSWTYVHLFNRSHSPALQAQKNVLNKCECWWREERGQFLTLENKYSCLGSEVSKEDQSGQKKCFKVLETKFETCFEHILLGRQLIHTCYSRWDILALFSRKMAMKTLRWYQFSGPMCDVCVWSPHQLTIPICRNQSTILHFSKTRKMH